MNSPSAALVSLGMLETPIAGFVGSRAAKAGESTTIIGTALINIIVENFTFSPYSEMKVALLLTVANPRANVAVGYSPTRYVNSVTTTFSGAACKRAR